MVKIIPTLLSVFNTNSQVNTIQIIYKYAHYIIRNDNMKQISLHEETFKKIKYIRFNRK